MQLAAPRVAHTLEMTSSPLFPIIRRAVRQIEIQTTLLEAHTQLYIPRDDGTFS
jgi:hypothetical protein